MIRFGMIGTGWRTEFFLRIVRERPDLFACVGVVTRDVAARSAWAAGFGVALFGTLDELLAHKPLFVVTSVTWDANPGAITELARRGIPILSETPPAASIETMSELYGLVESGAKIAVAEQFHLQPHHAARIAFAHSGKMGRIVEAQVAVCHGYHATSLIRRLLGVMVEDVTVSAKKFVSPVIKGRGRDGQPDSESIIESTQVIATLDFGDRLGVFDFTDVQYFSAIRGQRVLVRGERGEIINDTAVYMQDYLTPISLTFKRSNAGENGNHEGLHLRGILAGDSWIYTNPFIPGRLSDEEIAIASCLVKMAEYADGAPAFYPLAEACQDRYLDILIWESVEKGHPVTSTRQNWAGYFNR